MPPVPGRTGNRLRVGALLAAGSVAVHELRYLIAYGGDAPRIAGHEGHAYLALAAPAVGVILAGIFSAALVRAAATGEAHPRPAFRGRRAWPLCAGVLLAVFISQELAEGALSGGHPDGLAGVLGGGGVVAVPLSLLGGGLLTLALRASDALERAAADGRLRSPRPLPPLRIASAGTAPAPCRAAVVAHHLGGRGPPIVR